MKTLPIPVGLLAGLVGFPEVPAPFPTRVIFPVLVEVTFALEDDFIEVAMISRFPRI